MLELFSVFSRNTLLLVFLFSLVVLMMQGLVLSRIHSLTKMLLFEVCVLIQLAYQTVLIRFVYSQVLKNRIIHFVFDQISLILVLLVTLCGLIIWIFNKNGLILAGALINLLLLPLPGRLPYGYHAIFMVLALLLLALRAAWLLRISDRQLQHEITDYAFKAAFDVQHSGILIYEPNGEILLVNPRMLSLMLQLTGRIQNNAQHFVAWLALNDPAVTPCEASQREACVLHTPDLRAWQFQIIQSTHRNRIIHQLTATDVTEREQINQALRAAEQDLLVQHQNLLDTLNNIDVLRREDAVNKTWNHLHSVLGQQVSLIERILRENPGVNDARVLALVRELRDKLVYREMTAGELFQSLQTVFENIGVKMHCAGAWPSDGTVAEDVLEIIRESVINAVRHGNARQVWIKMTTEPGHVFKLQIQNDGSAPSGAFEWGGGLTDIKQRVDRLGGIFEIEAAPSFTLSASLPLPDPTLILPASPAAPEPGQEAAALQLPAEDADGVLPQHQPEALAYGTPVGE